jgi:branched-chain amino acid transport system substrate-binding protein
VSELTTAFQRKYGYPPPQFAQDGYSGVKLFGAAVEKAKSVDHDKLQAALEGLSLVTPNGLYKYSKTDHSGLTADYIAVCSVRSGRFEPTEWTRTQVANLTGK